jgi:phage tail sheath protein FI
MPEYLTPGVFIEEPDVGPKTIEGVSTSTAGFIGKAERGPVNPKLVTSFEEFQRIFGSYIPGSFLAYSIEGFFNNGGKRCYVSRVYPFSSEDEEKKAAVGTLTLEAGSGGGIITVTTNGDGEWGNRVYLKIEKASLYLKDDDPASKFFFKLIVYYFSKPPSDPDNPDFTNVSPVEVYDNLSVMPSSNSYYKNAIEGVSNYIRLWDNFLANNIDETTLARPEPEESPKRFEGAKGANADVVFEDYNGQTRIIDNEKKVKTGLAGLLDIEDISIMCAPEDNDQISKKIVEECSKLKDRFAIIQPSIQSTSDLGNLEPVKDDKYAATYIPWLYVNDPLTRSKKLVPPCGHIAGIYARVDNDIGVHKAPANVTVNGMTSLQYQIDENTQGILNPKGINVIRSFRGRGPIVWGARTISRDPMWKYINVRRLFIFVEKSVKRSMQWAVFEPNNERLWSRVKTTISQFLISVWKTGALMGTKPEEAFFVVCDRTVMTQNDLDNGRLIVVVGLAATKPAEFVICRFVQWQSGTSISELL